MLGVLLVIAYICVNNISKRQNIFVRIFHIFLFTLILQVQAFAHNGSSSKLIYIENKGQWHQNVRFKTNIRNGAIYLENNKITVNVAENNSHKFDSSFDFSKPCNAHAYNIEFLNCNLQAFFYLLFTITLCDF